MSALASAIYEGRVTHRRHAPTTHGFDYRMAQLYLDLDELDAVFRERWLWSVGRSNLASFRREDFLGDPAVPLAAVAWRRQRAPEVPGLELQRMPGARECQGKNQRQRKQGGGNGLKNDSFHRR